MEVGQESPKKSPSPTTPIYQASSTEKVSVAPNKKLKSIDQTRTPSAAQTPGFVRNRITVTPHGKAARRELYLRAGLTPARYRRKNDRYNQRETPRDYLRALSRLLADKSQPIVATPEALATPKNDAEEDDESEIVRPRSSLPLRHEDEDDSLILPPESAGIEDDNFSVKSIELFRHAVSEKSPGKFSRGSFGSVRMSDVFNEMSDVGLKSNADESSYMVNYRKDDPSIWPEDYDEVSIEGATETLKIPTVGSISSPVGRESGIRLDSPVTEETGNFVFNIPPLDYSGTQRHEENYDDQATLIEGPTNKEDLTNEENLDTEWSLKTIGVESDLHNVAARERGIENSNGNLARRNKVKLSRQGIPYPSLPTGVVKKLAVNYAKTAGDNKPKINKETVDAIMQATDWFFEQASDDLGAYAMHAGRKTINESDVITLMKRQRQINASKTPFFLAQRHLPPELLQELRMSTHLM
ncbi:putative histone-fold containing protein [Golovinomyces cichoracearum]|uniref:Putative histone-fold containing protein n=1 Tax=Golovinomyces cichoracearum TaxID=62708 RepID=A0A420IK23_9PEZI|nr:putative histone-fold containing protein [Golovinomyces cichoracearum]